MQVTTDIHDAWASLLVYPDLSGSAYAVRGLEDLRDLDVPGAEKLGPMEELLRRTDVWWREELFTRTFDGSADRALEIGWQLHGENYARGALMVRLRKLLGELNLVETSELSDHLGVVLGLIGRLDEERAGALARGLLIPAVEKLLAGFGEEPNPYRSAIEGLQLFLEDHYGTTESSARPSSTTQGNLR